MPSYYASPQIPAVPHTTPASVRTKLRAPIHNPYDKFTRDEFDAWIGDLTSRIKRVLTHGEPAVNSSTSLNDQGGVSDVSGYDDGPVEDSFAEVKARRAAKGKERADVDDSEDEEFVESIVFPPDEPEEEDSTEEEQTGEEEYDEQVYSDEEEVPARTEPPETIEISSDEDEEPAVLHPSSSPRSSEAGPSVRTSYHYHHNDLSHEDEYQPESDEAEEDFPPHETHDHKAPPVELG
ncbi:hypothetical protein NM688_g5432 [Phlebia brevispora]|uniref:Uncharacterized protein n=1 Tax=Phlebia brevispora TaxID=194682 RepID=A0ACC1SVD0_9APHY|nr:hypothetical protein NM688_g5432 [Phlebia brevispora]